MKRVLIIGIESVAGANIAATCQKTHEVSGISSAEGVDIGNCRVTHIARLNAARLQQQIQAERPDWIVFCGQSARSSWDSDASGFDDELAIDGATIAAGAQIRFTMISSDAIFTGPWMLHSESDTHFCDTPQATRLREIEERVVQVHESAMIVRTNIFGWSPLPGSTGFAELSLTAIETESGRGIDFLRHSNPILSTDLANLLLKAEEQELTGFLHLAGAERVSPFGFAERLAQQAGLAAPCIGRQTALSAPVTGFGCGETTLNCRRAVTALKTAMPLISEGLSTFLAQRDNGHCDCLRSSSRELSRVA